jgi:hypothetical protein
MHIDLLNDALHRTAIPDGFHSLLASILDIMLNRFIDFILTQSNVEDFFTNNDLKDNGLIVEHLLQIVTQFFHASPPSPMFRTRTKLMIANKGTFDSVTDYLSHRYPNAPADKLFIVNQTISEALRWFRGKILTSVKKRLKLSELIADLATSSETVEFYQSMDFPSCLKYDPLNSLNEYSHFGIVTEKLYLLNILTCIDCCTVSQLMNLRLVCKTWNDIIIMDPSCESIWRMQCYYTMKNSPFFTNLPVMELSQLESIFNNDSKSMNWYNFYVNRFHRLNQIAAQFHIIHQNDSQQLGITNYFRWKQSIDDNNTLGQTRKGGEPDLPNDITIGDNLKFVVQINLNDLKHTFASCLFPIDSGLLILFSPVNNGDNQAHAILYTGNLNSLNRGNTSASDISCSLDTIHEGLSCSYIFNENRTCYMNTAYSLLTESTQDGMFCELSATQEIPNDIHDPIVIWRNFEENNISQSVFVMSRTDLMSADFSRIYFDKME